MKIKQLTELAQQIETEKAHGKTIVQCHGVFDLLHIGHIRYFKQAKAMGDILVVTITPDQFVDKGPHRPAFPENLRAEGVASLSEVDYVAINSWPTAEETLRLLRPDIYVKGAEFKEITTDMTGKIGKEAAVIKEIGAKIAFTEDIVFSSTNLINRYLSNLPEELNQYLDLFRQRYSTDEIMNVIDKMAELKVLVVGDTILDDYQYCEPIGKSSKDPVLTVKYQSHDIFAGGVLAVANHVANFCKSVDLVTTLGEKDSHEDFIRAQLHPKVTPLFAVQPDAPTLIKQRFVDGYSFNKLFEVYIMDDSCLPEEHDEVNCEWMKREMANFDLVIAADFGHGAISHKMVDTLCRHAPFLAVNTQANSGNRGFHTITRYSRADYASLAEHEIRLEMRDRTNSIRPMMEHLAAKLNISNFVVTRGRKGCLIFGNQENFVEVPSFAQHVVDRVGAGDSFFAISALAARLGVPDELIGFIGNIAGGLSVAILGNKNSIDKISMKKYITSLMK